MASTSQNDEINNEVNSSKSPQKNTKYIEIKAPNSTPIKNNIKFPKLQ